MRTFVNSPSVRNNTLVIINSDHGNHVIPSKIHASKLAAMFDQKNPMMYLLVPPWVSEKYPDRVESLLVNSRERVTTNIDVHMTISHLMKFSEPTMANKHGQSLFTTIPKNRTCADAGISVNYCACFGFVQLDPKSVEVVLAAYAAVEFMNKQLVAVWEEYGKSGVTVEDGRVVSTAGSSSSPAFCQKWRFSDVKMAWLLDSSTSTGIRYNKDIWRILQF
jgi:hypothetical protein